MNSDHNGFIIPDHVLTPDHLSTSLRGIKRDTTTLIRLLKGQATSSVLRRAKAANPNRPARESVATPVSVPRAARVDGRGLAEGRARDSRGRFVASEAARAVMPVERAVRQLSRQEAQQAAQTRREAQAQEAQGVSERSLSPQQRDARGRFGSSGTGSDEAHGGGKEAESMLSRLKTAFSSRLDGAGDLEKIDPAIEAANEVRNLVAAPVKTVGAISKAMGKDGDGKKANVPWYRRILGQLRLMRKEDRDASRAELRAIAGIPAGGGGGGEGSSGIVSSLLSKLPAGGVVAGALRGAGSLLGRAALPVAAIGSAVKSFNTSTDEYAKRLGVEDDGSLGKGLAIRSVGVLGDLGNTLTFGGAGKLGEMISPAVSRSIDWVLGKTSSRFESGKRGAAAVSSGKGDNGGASYGTYQLSSKQGTLSQFLKETPYGEKFKGLQPGTPAFDAKWKEIAGGDAEFGAAQHDFIKRTHYDPQVDALKSAGIDLSGRGQAVQDAIWSTSVQFGGKSKLIQSALKGKDIAAMSDADIVSAVQDYKIANNDSLFKKSSAKVREGTLARASAEKASLVELANQSDGTLPGSAPTATSVTVPSAATSPAVSAPSIQAGGNVSSVPSQASVASALALPVPPRVDLPVQLSSPAPQVVTLANDAPVGQDVKDRRLAQIATGGMSGG